MVNVNDYSSELPQGDLLEAIFNHQNELIHKYHPIEEKNVGHKLPFACMGNAFDLNDPASQLRLKDFAWRVTEEIAEATECSDQEDNTHFLEELIDALHFLVEMTIYCGISPDMVACFIVGQSSAEHDYLRNSFRMCVGGQYHPPVIAYRVVENLGRAMNCLKNKPWKQTHMITDQKAFTDRMLQAWLAFIWLLKMAGLDAEKTTIFYLNKNAVNQFRIRSSY